VSFGKEMVKGRRERRKGKEFLLYRVDIRMENKDYIN